VNILDWNKKKQDNIKITMVTCYDYTSAKIISKTEIDSILVGDSAAMTMHGHNSTVPATLDMMCAHLASVVKGAPNKFIVGDIPFLANRKSLSENMNAVEKIMQAGAHAVKIEGVFGNESLISHIVESGVPVMGHLGLTPQSVHQLGGYKVQGRQETQAEMILQNAHTLQKCGAFSVVLECVPSTLADTISKDLTIPTIGIGAGPDTDGQILVFQDLLGLNPDFKPKFVRSYLNGSDQFTVAINQYCNDVRRNTFPSPQESFE
jgi:3-methyl-2-oxobutanoate hydroxymethyltransferase